MIKLSAKFSYSLIIFVTLIICLILTTEIVGAAVIGMIIDLLSTLISNFSE
jgi:hypothetical protein